MTQDLRLASPNDVRGRQGLRGVLGADAPWHVYLYLVPALALLAVVFVIPMVLTIWLSLHQQEGLRPGLEWVGLTNYRELVTDSTFWMIALQTVVWTVAVVVGTTAIGFALAHVLTSQFRGKAAFRAAFILPWATSIAVSAVAWRYAMAPEGLVNHSLSSFGLDLSVAWLANTPAAAFAVIFVGVWVSVPFTAVMLAAAMRSIPAELFEAAELDSAGPIARSLLITLPVIRRVLLTVTLANTLVVFNSFAIIYVMTDGGPVNKTEILATYLYRVAFSQSFDIGLASAIAVMIMVALGAFAVLYVRTLTSKERARS